LYYDGWGRKTKIEDPSAGTFEYIYNDWGEIIKEITPNGNTLYTYDNNGKIQHKEIQGNTSITADYYYDSNTKLLTSINCNRSGNYTYTYDNTYKRLQKTEENINGNTFTKEFTYDSFGRINTTKYTSQRNGNSFTKIIKNEYLRGELKAYYDNTNNLLYKILTVNERGQIINAEFGNNNQEINGYDQFGFITHTNTIQDIGFTSYIVGPFIFILLDVTKGFFWPGFGNTTRFWPGV